VKVVYLADAPYIHEQRWIRHFAAQGVDCEVISFRPAQIEGVRVHHIDGAEALGKARYLIHARRVRALVHSLKPDLLHALHLTSYGFLGALSAFHPFVLSVFGTDILEAPHLTPFHRWLTRYSLARADAITATGLHLATETTRYAPQGKPVVSIPYGVDLDRFLPAERTATDRVVIGTVARMSPEKGLPYLIVAFAALRARFGDRVWLRIAGDTTPEPAGAERKALEAQVRRLGLNQAVELAGWLPHADLPAFLQGLDVFVQSSTYEGFGVAAVEASAMALPVVASDVYGLPDVVNDGVTGLLVSPKSPAAIADAVSRLIEDPTLRHQLGNAGRVYVSRHYNWDDNAAQMQRVYDSLLKVQDQPVESGRAPPS
jgi:glycosyltransferase involved in cell wall biosynthesis